MDYEVELDQRAGARQQEERLTVTWADGGREEMRLHEYDRVYAIPGLYEEVVQRRLKCASPTVLASSLVDEVRRRGERPEDLNVLDMGAGNGVVGEELRAHGVRGALLATDTSPVAPDAAERDRPGLYLRYLVGDLSELPVADLAAEHRLTCLAGAGALGLGHISAESFDAAWRAFPPGAWFAVTASEEVLRDDDLGGYVAELRGGAHGTELLVERRFRHRLRMSGEPIYYVVLVARRAG